MKIVDKIKKVRVGIVLDTFKGGTKGFDLKVAAVNAALGGINSEAWRKYMTIFADNEAQLNRLTAKDPQAVNPWIKETSAYMVANGTCGGETPNNLLQGIDERIDADLSFTTDPNFQRHITFDPIP